MRAQAHQGSRQLKKDDNFTNGEPAEHREPWTSAPQGEPRPPPSVLTPQSPCTATRAVGVGTLYWDTIYAAAGGANVKAKPMR